MLAGDVPNLSTSLYFVVNDGFARMLFQCASLPEGVIVGSLSKNAHLIGDYYNRLAANDDAVSSLNTMLAQDGLLVYVPRGVVVDRAIQVINILKTPLPPSPLVRGRGRLLFNGEPACARRG